MAVVCVDCTRYGARLPHFVYDCRFHSYLDEYHQPVTPGSEGGLQDSNRNFGMPLMGVIAVLPGE